MRQGFDPDFFKLWSPVCYFAGSGCSHHSLTPFKCIFFCFVGFVCKGVAQGNAALFTMIAVLVIMFLVKKIPNFVQDFITDDEVTENSQELAEALKMIENGQQDEMGKEYVKIQSRLKKFLAADLSSAGGNDSEAAKQASARSPSRYSESLDRPAGNEKGGLKI